MAEKHGVPTALEDVDMYKHKCQHCGAIDARNPPICPACGRPFRPLESSDKKK